MTTAGEATHEDDDLVIDQQAEAEAEAEFEAAFNNARADNGHAEGTTSGTAPAPAAAADDDADDDGAAAATDAQAQADAEAAAAQAAAQAQADAEAAAAAEANAPVTVTRAELEALRASALRVEQLHEELRRTNDTANGRFGSLKQTIDAIKAQAQNGTRPTAMQLKRISEEYPEIAKLLQADLEEAFGPGQATAPAAAPEPKPEPEGEQASGDTPGAEAQADPFANPIVQQTLREKEMEIVDAVHPGWRKLPGTPEFQEWVATLPPAAQELLSTTWESKVMIPAFKDFKAYQQNRAAAAEANKQRGKRLEHGTPATNGSPSGANVVDEDAAFESGFNKVRGK